MRRTRKRRRPRKRFRMTAAEFDLAQRDCVGYCIYCGEWANGVAPDQREVRCELCAASEVHGVRTLFRMDRIEIRA